MIAAVVVTCNCKYTGYHGDVAQQSSEINQSHHDICTSMSTLLLTVAYSSRFWELGWGMNDSFLIAEYLPYPTPFFKCAYRL